ncbi:MAG: DUF58 domain-containing protein [Kiritimatiellae bacterium]|nr:DUF58 domain-containing protein [Kiritimatiellia bacterium]
MPKPAASKTDTATLMKRVAGIRLLTVRLVNDQLAGDYHSSFKGQGIEFDEVRPYVPGDDVRAIDWNVTARSGAPHIKRFAEERELTVIFLVDVSGSQACGSGSRTKSELSALLTCILAMAAVRNADKIGLINFSDRIVKAIPPRKGRTAVMRLVRDVLAADDATRHGTDIAAALRYLNNVQKRRALVFLISDFQDRTYESELRVTAQRHDLVVLAVHDPRELSLPNVGLVEVQDPETGGLYLLDTGSSAVRDHFARQAGADREALALLLRRYGLDGEFFSTGDSDDEVVHKLRRLFNRRERRGGRRR